MKLVELVFREVNVVLVHAPLNVAGISLDRVRSARPAANIQVSSSQGSLGIIYPDERLAATFETQRITVTDSSTRGPEISPVVEAALAQMVALGSPPAMAFGFNIRFDFEVEGMEAPGARLMEGVIRDPGSVAQALRTSTFQAGLSLVYQRGVKLWTLRMDPILAFPRRLGVHANIHEDLRPQPAVTSQDGPPVPPWFEGATKESSDAALPGAESMKADLAVQSRAALDTVANLLSLAGD